MATRDEPPLIVVDRLTKRYGDKVVLDDLSLEVERGETMVIIGGSGSGKTTLARHLVGLERPTSGRICVGGTDLASLSERDLITFRHRLSMVFQGGALLDSMSIYDNVAFPLREETSLDEADIRARVLHYLTELEIRDAADKLPEALSGGMIKRASLARALVLEPGILVYDEPTSGLDPLTSRVVNRLIDEMRARFLVTSVVITHDMATAFEVADHIAILAAGRNRRPRYAGRDVRVAPRRRRKVPDRERRRSGAARLANGAPNERRDSCGMA